MVHISLFLLLTVVLGIDIISGFTVNQVLQVGGGKGGQKGDDNDKEWADHKKKYNIPDAEEAERKENYDAADAFIKAHNADPTKTSIMAHNHLSHLHESEKKILRGHRELENTPLKNSSVADRIAPDVRSSYPASLDWRDYNGNNYLSPIQNQGQCGSCWTFSATATLESRWAIVNGGSVPKLSEQNIVDCCHTQSSCQSGCNGGNVVNAWAYVASYKDFSVGWITGTNTCGLPKAFAGQERESDYPYTGKGGTCKFSNTWSNIGAYTSYYNTIYYNKPRDASYDITANSPSAFKKALQSGPVSVAIDASASSFSYYSSGTIQAYECGTSLDHAVNVIGYGSDSNGDFWLLRNSWGTGWGLSGYMKFARTDYDGPGTCGVLKQGSYPLVKAQDK